MSSKGCRMCTPHSPDCRKAGGKVRVQCQTSAMLWEPSSQDRDRRGGWMKHWYDCKALSSSIGQGHLLQTSHLNVC